MEKYIIKEDGEHEIFNESKVKKSLLKAGTQESIADYIIEVIKKHLEEVSRSKDVYRLVLKQLKKRQPNAALKYTLKKSIMDLGPSGYVFEKYVARILKEHGYDTEVSRIIDGLCVSHEVDVIAHKKDEHFMIECKYHNNAGAKIDIQTALYVFARFLDLQNAKSKNDYNFSQVWLATNTKCTTDVIQYANCVKMKILAWHYPDEKNLEYYIESKRLYPISILPGLKSIHKDKLFDNDILTIKDLLQYKPEDIERLLSIDKAYAGKLFAMAAILL